ncbi:hypothetical protein EBAPG3_002065 [Nitrosospira lacus]|uniref:Uncharacterized protein n=1 Tax=Nitrosospira lacus TaxID=1288494 RepID=A0A1W6SLF7_9PROT|nr:hypothetical protein [Nitrosospira lacus]ARO86658.1 hypothetical protein EBAPG3_002065 [Nitrosospira lacus]
MTRRIDPEPVVIFMAFMGTIGAMVGAVNYVKTHYKPLPSQVREKLVRSLRELDDHIKHLRADLANIEEIFLNARFPRDRTIRLGNGAYLTPIEFARYEKVSDKIFCRIREVQKLSLKIEREATKLDALNMAPTTNVLGQVYERQTKLMEARNLTLEEAWGELHGIAQGLECAIEELEKQLKPVSSARANVEQPLSGRPPV